MKKFFIVLVTALLSFGSYAFTPPRTIDEKLAKAFKSSFPDAREVSWSELPHTYIVNFIRDGIRSRVIYPKDGSYIHLTRYYFEQNLPFNLRYKVNQEYPDKRIHSVVEISTISGEGKHPLQEFYIKLEDDTHWITVKADSEGSLTVVEKYRKA